MRPPILFPLVVLGWLPATPAIPAPAADADAPAPPALHAALAPQQFAELHALIKTQPGESLFWELPWRIQLHEALEAGAALGKPVFVWCGAGGAPVGVC